MESSKKNMTSKPRLFLVDGSSYIYRAYFAIGNLSTSTGFPTNAIFGFCKMLLKVIKDHKPDYLAVVFDTKGSTFRHEIYKEYKSNRPTMPDDLALQVPYIKDIVDGFNIPALEVAGFEADDIIGTLSKEWGKERGEVIIITGDKDMFQLITENVTVFDTMKDAQYGVKEIMDRFCVEPHRLVEIMGLAGDTSDNIPGIPGIGEKTAIELIREFGTIENLIDNVERVSGKRRKENILEFADTARLSKELATIDTAVPLPYDFKAFTLSEPDMEKIEKIFKELEFNQLLKEFSSTEALPTEEYHVIFTKDDFKGLLNGLRESRKFAFDTETTAKDPMLAELVGLSFSYRPNEAFYIPLSHNYLGAPVQLGMGYVLKALKPIFEDETIQKIGQNIKYDYLVLQHYDISLSGILFDTMVASYLLNPSKHNHNLEDIAREYLNHQMISYKDVAGTGKNALRFDQVDIEKASVYACEDADVTFLLYNLLLPKLEKEGFKDLYYHIEMPLIEVLANMEKSGVNIDVNALKTMSCEMEGKLNFLVEEIYAMAGEKFNINSPKQLGNILFLKLKLPSAKRTKTGYSTDVNVLNRLALEYELPAKILQYRSLTKLKSTYLDALTKIVHPETKRIHTSYNQTVTATGRLSSSDPNLQNIPIKTQEGRRIRKAFITEHGRSLVSADYSQVELRLLAHISKDDLLVDSFNHNRDIHTETAAKIFDVCPSMVTSEMRRQAKVVNFGIIYGMRSFGLAKELGISVQMAQDYIDNYFQRHQGVKGYTEEILIQAKENGYVATLLNRRRYLPEINSKNHTVRQFAERTAINTPIQGSAADLIKAAMINIFKRLRDMDFCAIMIMQVHDELVFEVPDNEVDEVVKMVREEMEGVMKLLVPLRVDIGVGKDWDEAHS
ncbi:MAG: DNA polymerase I [Thermodesulfobacteriota bacterium]|nr:DNA polymerase I [Thermodesulfobacteriota bacterium]